MDESNVPRLTEAAIRQLADEQSFERGMDYYESGAVQEPIRRGSELHGMCYSARDEPYKVEVVLGENGVREASCTCPRGGFCKHIVALLLTYVHEPEAFYDLRSLEAMLARFRKEDLITLIENMVQRDTSLLEMVKRMITIPAESGVDVAALRREVQRALRYRDPYDIEASLRDLLKLAKNLAEKEDWLGAGTVYQEVLDALAACYDDELRSIDDEGGIGTIAGDCVEGLGMCLNESGGDNAARQDWLATLMEAELADTMMGGVDFAADAFEIVMAQATDEEWSRLEERVREFIPKSDGWARETLVNLLVAWREAHGRHDEAREIIRELGTIKQVMFLLVEERKPGEAVALAREHFTQMPGIIIDLARALTAGRAADYAATLLSELASSDNAHSAHLEWLAEYYRKKGDLEAALQWQRALFLGNPTVKSFAVLRKVSEGLGVWEEVRTGVLEALEGKNKVGPLIEVALHEGDVARALELLPRVPAYSWGDYRQKVARAAEKKRPLDAIALYRQMAEATIGWRQRKTYREAAQYLRRMKVLYERLGNRGEWEEYLARLRKEFARFPALLDELQKAGL